MGGMEALRTRGPTYSGWTNRQKISRLATVYVLGLIDFETRDHIYPIIENMGRVKP